VTRGLSGSLLSREAVSRIVPAALSGLLGEDGCPAARRHLREWYAGVRRAIGPTASARVVLDVVAVPLSTHLGFDAVVFNHATRVPYALLNVDGCPAAVLLVTPWGEDAGGAWRDAVRRGIAHDVRWCFSINGSALRLVDAARTYSRRFAEFDLGATFDDELTFAAFWGLLRAAALSSSCGPAILNRALDLSDQHRTAVRDSLKIGVHQALVQLSQAFVAAAGRPRAEPRVLDESLTVIYRVLFLLFAEARGLVPDWHSVYRDGYTLESLRRAIETPDARCRVWESLQAIARLAQRGCRAGSLRVQAFNGRLFSSADAPLADSVRLDDEAVRRALLALTSHETRAGRQRIVYGDLGVEQLGAVYEHVLDYAPARIAGSLRLVASGRRKATGSFYTPRSLTEYLVRRTLAPLVEDATPDEILRLRVVDPAMGSGAFLVAACRFLARAYEQALIRDGQATTADVTTADRIDFRRLVAQRCLHGVDINPMAVQLARLSLWLATLAGDRPLTFLDHHLRSGDSLVGASLADLSRQPPSATRTPRPRALPLLALDAFQSGLRAIVAPRIALGCEPDDTLDCVEKKERTLASLNDEKGPLARWKAAADLWCAAWFMPAADARTFGALLDELREGAGPLPPHVSGPLLEEARQAAVRGRYFHWTLEFPEAFYDEHGAPLERPGFDAILGNPPWEMLRADGGTRTATAELTRFARRSGIYPLQTSGHANLYQLFIERALSLVKPRGRLGLLVPSGVATDHGCAAIRRELLERTTLDMFLTLENREAIFPVHRGLKFALFTLTATGRTVTVPAHLGVRDSTVLDRVPDSGSDPHAINLPRRLLDRISGDQIAIPDIRSPADLEVVSHIVFTWPALGDTDGWNLRFGRELNASDDRPHLREDGLGLPVLEGKHVQPFRVDSRGGRLTIPSDTARRLLGGRSPFAAPRLAYRDVAAATNRLTLIAAIVPAGVVTTHTLFCVRNAPDIEAQEFLCAIFNSFVANYLVRMRVGTHVTTAVIDRLPVPKPPRSLSSFTRLASLARHLTQMDGDDARAEHQARVARLYGLSEDTFAHVLDSFPLVARAEREAALSMFRCIVGHG
jgi:hypothetical protein